MRYLYVLLVLSIAAILWAVWAVAKHVRRHGGDERRGSDAEGLVNNDEEAQFDQENQQSIGTGFDGPEDDQSRKDEENGSAR